MPITAPIPLPQNGSSIISDIPALIAQIRLANAQAQQAGAMGSESQMKASILQRLMSGQNGMQPNGVSSGVNNQPTQESSPSSGGNFSPNNALLLSDLMGFHTTPIDGMIATPFGNVKVGESPEEKSKREMRTNVAQKTLESTAANTLAGTGVNASFDALNDLMTDPDYDKVAGKVTGQLITAKPLGIPIGSWLQQSSPNTFTPHMADVVSQAQAHFGNIVTGVASKFKGPFKAMINGIIGNMKPDMGDSKVVQQGKVNAWKQLNDLGDAINGSIAEDVNNGMDPTAATLKAIKNFPASNFTRISNSVSKYKGNSSTANLNQSGSTGSNNSDKNFVDNFLSRKFSGPEEFNEAMHSLDAKTQQQVLAEMNARGMTKSKVNQ